MALSDTSQRGAAFGACLRAATGLSHGLGLYVLTLAGDRIRAMTRFQSSVLPWFGHRDRDLAARWGSTVSRHRYSIVDFDV